MSKQIDTAFLDELKQESDSIASQNRFTRLQLLQGDEATIRLLPVKLAGKKFFGKIGKHWVNKTVITCPRKTDAAYGGDPDAECPCCDICEDNRNHSDKEVADRAYACGSKPNYTMFVRVIKSNSRSFRPESKDVAHEFSAYGAAMDDLLAIYRRKAEKGVYLDDPVDGFDLFVRRSKRGTEINLDDQCELYPNDVGGKRLKAILSTVSFKQPTMPEIRELEKFATKIEDYCFSGSSKDDDRGRSDDNFDKDDRRDRTSRHDADEPERPARRGRDEEEAPARPQRSRDADSDSDNEERRPSRASAPARRDSDDDEIPGLPTPPPNRNVQAPPARRAEPDSVRSAQDEPAPRQTTHRHDDTEDDGDTAAEERRDAVPPRTQDEDESPSETDVPAPRPPSRLKDRLSKTIGGGSR